MLLANHLNHNMSREEALYPIKLIFIGILYIKHTNEMASIVVVFEAI
jgi:hypothetical protein